MLILSCDTSNSTCCAGVYEDGRELSYELSLEKRTHSVLFRQPRKIGTDSL